jgi:hypothetical protein
MYFSAGRWWLLKANLTNANHGNESGDGEWNESEISISHRALSWISMRRPWFFFAGATTDKVSHHSLQQ